VSQVTPDTAREVAQAHRHCRRRISELVRDLAADAPASTPVPACPGWSVHDLLSHLVGVAGDVLAGRLDGVATDPWTHAQVVAGRHRGVGELLDEWDRHGPPFEDMLVRSGPAGRQAVADTVTHEHDRRGAIGSSGARDSHEVTMAVDYVAPLVVGSAERQGLPIRIESTSGRRFGPPRAVLQLRGDDWEILRAMTGRRGVDQLRALIGEGDADSVRRVFTFGPFRPAALPIVE
jgi:uncharacterized protein (TIGR03083 family)